MPKTSGKYPFLKNIIEQWPVRAKRAGLRNKQLAKIAGVSESQFSQIINFRIKNPHLRTIQAVQDALEKLGV